MIVSGTKYQTVYDIFGSPKSEELVYGQRCADTVSGNEFMLAYVPHESLTGDVFYSVRLLSLSGSDTLIQLPAGIKSIALSDTRIYCCGENAIYIYSFSGEFERKIAFDLNIRGARKLSKNMLLLDTTGGIYSFAMK